MTDEPENTVQATERSLDIIEALRALDGARLTVIANHVDLPNSTVHNHLQTLTNRGYIIKENGYYRLSLRFLDLGEYTRSLQKIYRHSIQELDNLAAETDEVASLVVDEAGQSVFIYSAEGTDAVSPDTSPGTHVPMHVTAMGKAILAQLPDDEVEEIIECHGLPAYTDHTIVDEAALMEKLEAVREAGIATEDAERVRGTRSIAVPIRDDSGSVIGAIGITGPASRLTQSRMEDELAPMLHDATNIIELKRTYE